MLTNLSETPMKQQKKTRLTSISRPATKKFEKRNGRLKLQQQQSNQPTTSVSSLDIT
jgi:hypothetical protein